MLHRSLILLLVLLSATIAAEPVGTSASAAADADAFTVATTQQGAWDVHLVGATLTPSNDPRNLAILLRADGGRWQRIWGHALNLALGDSHGYVLKAEASNTQLDADVVMLIAGDAYQPWQRFARYRIRLQRSADTAIWTGEYTGTCHGIQVSGTAQATAYALPTAPPSYVPIARGEHPRLLFRASDIPALKAKLATPFGQAARAQMMSSVAGMGVLYQLTGDASLLESAKAPLMTLLKDESFGAYSTGQIWAPRLFDIAVAWDCMRDAWPADFNRTIEKTLLSRMEMLLWNCGGNSAPTSNWAGPRNAASGIVSLAMYGDPGDGPPRIGQGVKGPMPINPTRMGIYRKDQQPVIFIAGLSTSRSIPAPAYQDNQPFRDWLWTGHTTMLIKGGQDLVKNLGGMSAAVLAEGDLARSTVFSERGATELTLRVQRVPVDAMTDNGVALDRLLSGTAARTTVLSTTFTISEPRTVKRRGGVDGATVYLNNQLTDTQSLYHLQPGLHRVSTTISVEGDFANNARAPWLLDVTAQAQSMIAGIQLFALAERGDWLAKGRPDFFKDFLFECARLKHYQYTLLGMGEGGFHAEAGHYSHHAAFGPHAYAMMYHSMFGRVPAPRGNIAMSYPKHILSTVLQANGKAMGLPIHGINELPTVAYARLFPLLDHRYSDSALWYWQRTTGASADNPMPVLKDDPVCAFLAYPLGRNATAPVAPPFPLTWASPLRGYYLFRNRIADAQDAVVQIAAHASVPMGYNHPNAGSVTIQAFGQAWVESNEGRIGYRSDESVVLFPGRAGDNGHGRVTLHETSADGSGQVAINLDHVYAPDDKHNLRGGLYLDSNNIWTGSALPDQVRGGRWIAVDYSGKSGAPIMLVFVDRVDGGPQRYWHWKQSIAVSSASGAEMRSRSGANTMRVAVVHPQAPAWKRGGDMSVKVEATNKDKELQAKLAAITAKWEAEHAAPSKDLGIAGGDRMQGGGPDRSELERLLAEAKLMDKPLTGPGFVFADHAFVIVTLGPGEPPAVQVTGSGLDSVATIGGRSVRFDGQRIVIADK